MPTNEFTRVTGIGGVFFKAKDPEKLREWYRVHLGISLEVWGGAVFRWQSPANPSGAGTTVWSPFEADSDHFKGPSQFMINYRVADLDALLAALRAEGCQVDDKTDVSEEMGKFGWVTDPEGVRVELWEPPAGK